MVKFNLPKALRLFAGGMAQAEVARRLKVNRSTVSRSFKVAGIGSVEDAERLLKTLKKEKRKQQVRNATRNKELRSREPNDKPECSIQDTAERCNNGKEYATVTATEENGEVLEPERTESVTADERGIDVFRELEETAIVIRKILREYEGDPDITLEAVGKMKGILDSYVRAVEKHMEIHAYRQGFSMVLDLVKKKNPDLAGEIAEELRKIVSNRRNLRSGLN